MESELDELLHVAGFTAYEDPDANVTVWACDPVRLWQAAPDTSKLRLTVRAGQLSGEGVGWSAVFDARSPAPVIASTCLAALAAERAHPCACRLWR